METWIAVSGSMALRDVPTSACVLLGTMTRPARVRGSVYGEGRLRALSILQRDGTWRQTTRSAEAPCRLAVKAKILTVREGAKLEAAPARVCVVPGCGASLDGYKSHARCCSDACRAILSRNKKRAAREAARRSAHETTQAPEVKRPAMSHPGPQTMTSEPPAVRRCGADGCEVPLTQEQKTYCSRACGGLGAAALMRSRKPPAQGRKPRGSQAPKVEEAETLPRPRSVLWSVNASSVEEAVGRARANSLKVTHSSGGVVETVSRGFGGGWLLMRKVGTAIEFPRVFQDHKRDLAARGLIEIFGGADGRDIMAAWDRAVGASGARRR